jgi:uncharacterized protein YecE (DUF72 family)
VALLIGTSGWHYQHWRSGFYPAGVPATRWLTYYAERFGSVELNNAFYQLPGKEAFEKWSAEVPDDFVVAVKVSRYLTHVRRLREPQDPVRRLVDRANGLGQKLGPFLLQLPPTLKADLESLESTLRAFPDEARVAVEMRHASWFTDECRKVLEQRGAALCLADGGSTVTPVWRTANWTYVRFHRGRASPESCYGDMALRRWAKRLASEWGTGEQIFAYFNNDAHGCAPRDARRFAKAAEAVGLQPTRVPAKGETPITS